MTSQHCRDCNRKVAADEDFTNGRCGWCADIAAEAQEEQYREAYERVEYDRAHPQAPR